PRLRRNTNRLPPLARHKHCLHGSSPQRFSPLRDLCALCVKIPIPHLRGLSQRKQIPHRPICRSKPLLNNRQTNRRLRSQTRPQTRRQIRHLRYVKFPLRIQRMVYLPASIRRLSHRHAHLAQLFFRFSKQFHGVFPRARAPWSHLPNHPTEYRVLPASFFFASSSGSHRRYNFFAMQNQLAVETLSVIDWVKGLAAIPERDFTLQKVQDYIVRHAVCPETLENYLFF